MSISIIQQLLFWLAIFVIIFIPAICATKDEATLKPKPRISQGGIWHTEHVGFVKLARQQHQVAFYGDSITYHFSDSPLWKDVYVPMGAANFGIRGDRIEELWWRIRSGELRNTTAPKVAVVLIGTNNLWNTTNLAVVNTINGMLVDMHQIAPQTRVLLLGIFPKGPSPDETRIRIKAINKNLERLANNNWLYYLDFGAKFVEKDGTILPSMMPDFLHLSNKGYEIWEREMRDTLQKLLSMPQLKVKDGEIKGGLRKRGGKRAPLSVI